ncbi:MAG: hypothetical protein PCFJNLEI_00643 [Verrucomicrobiae bacterium]|nr:hypothetical protein [Verrucomicrobiae bacterium]
MNSNARYGKAILAAALSAASAVMAGERRIELKDFTGRGFAPDVISYSVTIPNGGASAFRLTGPEGQSLPVQVAPAPSNGAATLSFVADLPANSNAVYRLRDDGQGPVAASPLKLTREQAGLIVENGLFGVRLAAPRADTFDKPVAAATLPAPILAFRSGDGPWLGAGRILTQRPVKALRVRVTAEGPVFAEIRYEMDFAPAGWYRATIRVSERVPLARVTEEFDAGELDGRDYWELSLTTGWTPDMIEQASATSGTGFEKNKITPITSLGVTPEPIQSPWIIIPDSAWYAPLTMLGVFNAADMAANSNRYPVVGFVPLNKGDWRRMIGIDVHTPDSKQISLHLPMTLRHASWLREVTSETAPFSVLEHENYLPATYGRRIWGLLLAHPAVARLGDNKVRGPLALARLLYGVISLDRYKDYILEWPDGKPTYPRVFLKPDQIEALRKTAGQSPLAAELRKGYLATGDDQVAATRMKDVRRQLDGQVQYMVSTPTVGHHAMGMGAYIKAGLADDILAWPGLRDEDRRYIRSKLALAAYLYMEGDVISYANGSHTGPPNMGVAVSSGMSTYIALLPDHPMYAKWLMHADEYLQYKTGVNMAPGGGWFEYGGAYHMHGYARLNNGIMGLQAAAAPGTDRLQEYNRQDWSYYMNLLTPYDSRWQVRMVPGMANSPPSRSGHFMEASGVLAEKYPELAANLRWAWLANGTGDNDINVALERPWIQPKEPALKSEIYPGVGIIFRAHQGPEETYLFLRSGYNWSHWPEDQGHFVLMSKGAMLVPYQPFQYGGSGSKEFDMCNLLRFGSPANRMPHSWTDANILDHAFGKTVDYAWSSVGYPDWYFSPGGKREFLQAQGIPPVGTGNARPLAAGIEQKPGPFDWDRQVLFLKSANPKGPNYFVFRDSVRPYGDTQLASWFNLDLLGRKTDVRLEGARIMVDTEWPTKLAVVFAQKEPLQVDMVEQNMHIHAYGGGKSPGYFRNNQSVSRNWRNGDGSAITNAKPVGVTEQHVILRLGKRPGEDYFWVAYPQAEGERPPEVISLKPGAAKIKTSEQTDYVFLSSSPFAFAAEDVAFEGCAGTVRVGKDTVTLALVGGSGKVGYQGHVIEGVAPIEQTIALANLKKAVVKAAVVPLKINYTPTLKDHQPLVNGVRKAVEGNVSEYLVEAAGATPITLQDGNIAIEARRAAVQISPTGIRLVALDRTYCRLTVGNVGVRGVGPFDLTFTAHGIKGTVDGVTRTLVCTWPEKIVRPMYCLDGVRWYAGFADDHTINKGTATPQFAMAFGVTEGRHQVEISEWTYPGLPPVPDRASLK